MIEVIVLDKELYHPSDIAPKTAGSAGLDLKLTRDAKSAHELWQGGKDWPCHDLIPTGIKVRVPTNMVGLVVPRSSTGHKHGFRLGNTVGIIDSDYRGEIQISVGGGDLAKMKRGYVAAQLILVPYASFYGARIVDEFSDAATAYGQGCRAEGGFGSTDALEHTASFQRQIDREMGVGAIDRAFAELVITGTGGMEVRHIAVEDLLLGTPSSALGGAQHVAGCPGAGCQDQGCPHHYASPLPETTRSVLGDAKHEAGCQQAAELNKLNGGF